MIHENVTREESYRLLKDVLETENYQETTPYNPLMVAFEITTLCNLRCIRCERRSINPIHLNRHMSEETFEKLSPLFSYVRGVSIVGGLGEPLLAPNFWSFVSQMKNKGAQVQYFTNGTRWTDVDIIKTFEREVACVSFSMDSSSRETYEKLKTGANYHCSVDRIDTFLRLRQETGGETKLMLNCAVQRDTLSDMVPLLRFSADRHIDGIWFTGVITHLEEQSQYSHLKLPVSELIHHFEAAAAEAKRLGVTVRLPAAELKKRQICKDIWTNLYVFYNGDICGCPHFREEKVYYYFVRDNKVVNEARQLPDTLLGNVHKEEVLSIWDGPKQQKMRRQMLSGTPVEPCRECHFSYDLH